MPTSRLRLLVVLAVVVVLGGAVAVWARRADPAPVTAAEPPGTVASTTTTTLPPTTPPPYRSVVATAAVPELEVFAERPPDPVGTTVAPTSTVPSPSRVQPIPRANLRSAGSRTTAAGWAFTNPTPFNSPLVVAVTEVDGDWVHIEIPARPNGQFGWVRAADVTLSDSAFRLELTLSEFTLRVYEGDAVLLETPVVIGTDATPTPVGTFYLGEILSSQQAGVGGPNGAYGPYILATNAYSESLDLFGGGLPVIAFHGTNNPGLVGTKASNGCVRMPNEVVTQLAETVPAGTAITVIA